MPSKETDHLQLARMPIPSLISMASIATADHLSATSKYNLVTYWYNPETEIELTSNFNINADVTVPAFFSAEAPARKTLNVEAISEDQFLGFDEFSGEIGGGRIFIVTKKGVKIKGEIVGGPDQGQSFVGAGSWTRA
ncbi:hypothetical protein BDV93DRAFT_526725 [Ceratobasidium sp. AG-I]|nr:hypothetical protein BDV93DRAFT_526725 [Ceratobasidium sp. AG-I]